MRAWILSSDENPENYSSLVWAESRGRAKSLDNGEELSEQEVCLRLIKDYGWSFYVGNEIYDEDNI